jgi:2-succinyl-6-hydroxy-2,4-cyclohexadiene-1-carboxylate synthase
MSDDRLVFLHGFTQTHHHWHECAHLVAGSFDPVPTVCLVDLPGHGLSDDDRSSIEQAAPALVELAGPGTYIGYSMGARYALAAACNRPPQIHRLVLVGGTAGLADPGERAARIADDEARADRIVEIGVDAFVEEWLSQPMFDALRTTESDRVHRRRNSADGLASSLRLAGTGAQQPLWERLAAVTVRVLVLAGERDTKFTEIGNRLTAAIPEATFAAIPGAGHAAHSEQPEATAELISRWLTLSEPADVQPMASPTASSAP